jgi:hypothetical protein
MKSENKLQVQLLSLIKDIKDIEYRFKYLISDNFNLFKIAGLVKQEIKHSRMLAYILDPSSNHGLKDQFIKELLSDERILNTNKIPLNALIKISMADFDDTSVKCEDMRIDILAMSKINKLLIVIENKVEATEGKGQLQDYIRKINADSRFSDYQKIFLYLTPQADEPSDERWIALGYKNISDAIKAVLEKNKMTIRIDVKLVLEHYLELIRRFILKEVDEDFRTACQALYAKHKEIFSEIIKISEENNSANEAIQEFIKTNISEIDVKQTNSRWLSFLPNELEKITPDVMLSKKWNGTQKPISFFYQLLDDRIRLVIEVGPMSDLEKRGSLVKSLFKNITGDFKEAKSDMYSRVWTKTYKLDENELIDVEPQAIQANMQTLFEAINKEKIVEKISKAIEEIFIKI